MSKQTIIKATGNSELIKTENNTQVVVMLDSTSVLDGIFALTARPSNTDAPGQILEGSTLVPGEQQRFIVGSDMTIDVGHAGGSAPNIIVNVSLVK